MRLSLTISAAALTLAAAGCALPSVNRGKVARTCSIKATRYNAAQTAVSPTMLVSSDGSCSGSSSRDDGAVTSMVIVAMPAHGTLALDLSNSVRPVFIYTPVRGYEGPDSFVVRSGPQGRVVSTYGVTVTK